MSWLASAGPVTGAVLSFWRCADDDGLRRWCQRAGIDDGLEGRVRPRRRRRRLPGVRTSPNTEESSDYVILHLDRDLRAAHVVAPQAGR